MENVTGDCCDIWVGKWIGENSIGNQVHRIEQKEDRGSYGTKKQTERANIRKGIILTMLNYCGRWVT